VEETLRQHCTCANVRGIRMPLNYAEQAWRRMTDRGDYMRDAQWRRGFALLSHYGLSFDLQMYDHQAAEGVALAQRVELAPFLRHFAMQAGPPEVK
jgi:predicted TIM-barrel fold metal-dependent hydrolase